MNTPDDYRFHSLLHASHLLDERLRENLLPLDIRPRQARVLDALERMGSASQVELTREFGITAGSMSTMVSRLEKRGLIQRSRHPDERRSDVLSLSDAGRSQLEAIHRNWEAMDACIDTAIGQEKAQLLAELTAELRQALGGRIPGQTPNTEAATIRKR